MHWDATFDERCAALAAEAVIGSREAWRELVARTGAELERWAAHHPTLRRWRLDGPDDARAVLVRVLERLSADRMQALAEYTTRRRAAVADADAASLLRLARLDEAGEAEEEAPSTPFRAWLRAVLRFAVYDHVRHRLGWVIGADRRDAGTGADRWSEITEPGHRPPVTDWISVRERMVAVDEQLAALPASMRDAVRGWAEGDSFEEIAARLGQGDAAAARRLVRAGHARLRDALRRVSSAEDA